MLFRSDSSLDECPGRYGDPSSTGIALEFRGGDLGDRSGTFRAAFGALIADRNHGRLEAGVLSISLATVARLGAKRVRSRHAIGSGKVGHVPLIREWHVSRESRSPCRLRSDRMRALDWRGVPATISPPVRPFRILDRHRHCYRRRRPFTACHRCETGPAGPQ